MRNVNKYEQLQKNKALSDIFTFYVIIDVLCLNIL